MIIVSLVWEWWLFFCLTVFLFALFLLENMMFFRCVSMLLIDDKQFFMIGIINSLSSYG
ncbi:hypothetical protein ECDEC2B_0941 [Escherichia coli DEC2B]|uniref:Uncharacterized protein n=1 Tax=Escherichia coli DEC2D TaxID=868141 RepID=A0A828U881_ECOLX|nr:hypothetical protein ECDEC1B_0892 [Escherichia coli DEC1B]EHU42659.1 hypothetical protein ECDEC2B_0941 [Escherichia coli DEC2B]EHU47449.1 hypothetical protein ECDEC2D_0904 [Escherichia coli DEC2D]